MSILKTAEDCLALFVEGRWESLRASGATLEYKDDQDSFHSMRLFLKGISEATLAPEYSSELIGSLRLVSPAAAAALAMSRLCLARAITSILLDDSRQSLQEIQSAIGAINIGLQALGIELSPHVLGNLAGRANHLYHILSSQVELASYLNSSQIPATLVFVLGMHRSGTSALTGMLGQAGLATPKDLMQATPRNTKGFWESREMMTINNSFLGCLGSHWSSAAPLPPGWESSHQSHLWRSSILRHIKQNYNVTDVPVIKDPRFCVLIPGLLPWLETGLIRLKFLVPIRRPLEVAQSLESAQNVPFAGGVMLWLHSMFTVLESTSAYNRLIVSFDELLDSPSSMLDQCLGYLFADRGRGEIEEKREQPCEYIDPTLKKFGLSGCSDEQIAALGPQSHRLLRIAEEVYSLMVNTEISPDVLSQSLQPLRQRYAKTVL